MYYVTGKNQHQRKSWNNSQKIVEESSFTHKDAYELGAMLIAIGDAHETITLIHNNPNYERIMKQREYKLIEERKQELERELRDL